MHRLFFSVLALTGGAADSQVEKSCSSGPLPTDEAH